MSDIESYLEKMKAVQERDETHPKQCEVNAARAANAIRNTYNLLNKGCGMQELINMLYKLYLQGGEDARKPLVEESHEKIW